MRDSGSVSCINQRGRRAIAMALAVAVGVSPCFGQAVVPVSGVPAGSVPASGSASVFGSVPATDSIPGVQPQPETITEAQALYRFPVGGVVTTGPVIAGGRVWLLSDAKSIYVLTVDGVAIGRRAVSERRSAFIACDSFGRAALSDGATGLALINRAGQEIWRAELGAKAASAPAFATDGRLFVACSDSLSAFAPNGSLLWRYALVSPPSSPLVIGPGGGPAIGLSDGSLLLFLPDGGVPRSVRLDSAPAAIAAGGASSGGAIMAALSNGAVVVVGPHPVDARALVALGSAVNLGSRPVSASSSADGFFVLGADGNIVAIDASGLERWRASSRADGGPASIAAFEGRVVVLTKTVAQSFGADGSLFRTLRIKNAATLPAIAPNGAVIVGGSDWITYAYRFERALVPAAAPGIDPVDMKAIDYVADQESTWSSAAFDDDFIMEKLADIEKSLKTGTIPGETRQAILYLAAVALGRLEAPFGSGVAAIGPTPRGALPRVMACGILGAMGLSQAVPILVDVFEHDDDSAVRAAAADAVAAIGLDPDGGALDAFARAAEGGRLDARAASAVVDAIDGLYRASGALDERSGALALVRISVGDYPRDLRAKAEKALKRVTSAR